MPLEDPLGLIIKYGWMSQGGSSKEVKREYVWTSPDWVQLGDALREIGSSWCPRIEPYAEQMDGNGNTTRIKSHNFEEWLRGLTEQTTSVWITFNSPRNRSITASWNATEVRVRLTVAGEADTATQDLTAIHALFETRLSLRFPSKNSGERSFALTSPDSVLADLVRACHEFVGTARMFRCDWEDSSGIRYESLDEAEWLTATSAARRRAEWSGAGHSVELDLRDQSRQLRLSVESWNAQNVSDGLQRIGGVSGLRPQASNAVGKLGEARRYFLSHQATLEWYERTLASVNSFAVSPASFWGRLSTRSGAVLHQRGYGDLDQWRGALTAALNEGNAERSYFSFQSSYRGLTFDLDHIRDLLVVDVQSTLLEEIEGTHADLVKNLHLLPAPENAWRYRRWGRTYQIKWLGGKDFASQLKTGLHELFGGRKIALSTATLHAGGGDEQVLSFDDVDSFFEAFAKTRDLSEVHLVANAPRGEFMGVHVERSLTQMRLLANTEFSSFRKFEGHLSNALRSLKVKETYDTDSGGGAVALSKDQKPGWAVPVLTAAIALATGLFGTELFKALREEPVLYVDIPVVKDGLAEVASSSPVIRWTFKEPRVLGRPEIDTHKLAYVDVTRQSDGAPVVDGKRGEGQYALSNLVNGDYTVRITAGDSQPKTLVLRVNMPSPVSGDKALGPATPSAKR